MKSRRSKSSATLKRLRSIGRELDTLRQNAPDAVTRRKIDDMLELNRGAIAVTDALLAAADRELSMLNHSGSRSAAAADLVQDRASG